MTDTSPQTPEFSSHMLTLPFNREPMLGDEIGTFVKAASAVTAFSLITGTAGQMDSVHNKWVGTACLIALEAAGIMGAVDMILTAKGRIDERRRSLITEMGRALDFMNGENGDWNGRDYLSADQQFFFSHVVAQGPKFQSEITQKICRKQHEIATHIGWHSNGPARIGAFTTLQHV